MFDYLIVGAGFAGSVLAERLAGGSNKRVLVVDRRPHAGGNAYDHHDAAGLLVHKYGPHIVHTNSLSIFRYLSRFTAWRRYEHRVLAQIDGKLVPIPINLDTVNLLYGLRLTPVQLADYFASVAEPRSPIRNSEDVVVSRVGRDLYEKCIRNYTRKHWGLDPSELAPSVLERIPARVSSDDRYFTDRYQAMPLRGFHRMFERMLDHPNITVSLGVEYRDAVRDTAFETIIYTGTLDEFFDYRWGVLPYRSVRFHHETLDQEFLLSVAQVNYPNDYAYTRVTEFKHLTGQIHPRTSVVYEYPCAEGEPYYPIPRPESAAAWKKYRALADLTPHVHFIGRLASYRYYNMDQVVGQALTLYAKLAGRKSLVAAMDAGAAGAVPVASMAG
jgi:UDP-galactopyranose mutase